MVEYGMHLKEWYLNWSAAVKAQSTKSENKGSSNEKRHDECEDILTVLHSYQ